MNVIQRRPSSFITLSMNKISRRVAFRIVSSRAGTLSAHSGDHNLGSVIVRALWRNSHSALVVLPCTQLNLPLGGILVKGNLPLPFCV